MSIEYIDKAEWQERVAERETVLIGAFAPALNQITMEIECRSCGRPIYISPYEKNASTVLCIICGLSLFNETDRDAISKAMLNPQAE
jgi:ribosomal protein S27E